MNYGYIRVSTQNQEKDGNSLQSQEEMLKKEGILKKNILSDIYTGKEIDRKGLNELMSLLKSGDKLVICKLDRLARSIRKGNDVVDELLNRGVAVHILNLGLLDNTANGKLIRNILFTFAEFEREMIIERCQSGKAIAKTKEGYSEGRPKKFNEEQLKHAVSLLENNSYSQVVKLTGISKSSLIRAKRKSKQKNDSI